MGEKNNVLFPQTIPKIAIYNLLSDIKNYYDCK